MASNAGWDKTVPSGTSSIADGDDDIRSFKSSMQAWWEQEHYATDGSANSAGIAKHGAGRAFVGTASQLSNPTADNDGRLFFVTDDNTLRVGNVSTSSWSLLADNVTLTSNNSWTGINQFTSAIDASGETFAGAREYIRFSEVNVTSSTSAQADLWGTPKANDISLGFDFPRAGSFTGLSMRTSGAQIAAGTIRATAGTTDAVSAFSLEMTSADGAFSSATTTVGLYTFSAGDVLTVYVDGDGSLSPSGSIDLSSIVLEVTFER